MCVGSTMGKESTIDMGSTIANTDKITQQKYYIVYVEVYVQYEKCTYQRKMSSTPLKNFNHDVIFPCTTRYDDENKEPTACVLIDLAIPFWGTPVLDLVIFLFISTTPGLRATHEGELLGFYHDELTRNLHRLGVDPSVYPYRQLLKDYEKMFLFGLVAAFQVQYPDLILIRCS